MICVCGMRGYQEEGHHGSYHRHLGNDDIVKQYDWCGITVWAVDESVVCEINVCVCV